MNTLIEVVRKDMNMLESTYITIKRNKWHRRIDKTIPNKRAKACYGNGMINCNV